eukprot:jgi/Picsp_1/6858/NSC_04195-R1_arp protein
MDSGACGFGSGSWSKSAALVSGAHSGIGLEIANQLFKRGVKVTSIDKEFSHNRDIGIEKDGRLEIGCDVTCVAAQRRAFAKHLNKFGRLDIAVLNAGVGETGDFIWSSEWKKCLDVDLIGVMEGVRLSVQSMVRMQSNRGGVILIVSSAGGLWPMPLSPVYSTAKAGCVMLTKSLGPVLWKKYGIRLVTICPQFVSTNLVRRVKIEQGEEFAAKLMKSVGGKLLSVEQVGRTMMSMIESQQFAQPGECIALLSSGQCLGMNSEIAKFRQGISRKIVVHTLSTNFRKATKIIEVPIEQLKRQISIQGEHNRWLVLVKNIYAGVNASDINFSSGKYHKGRPKLPMDAGFEACGIVVDAPSSVKNIRIGMAVATLQFGSFSEYTLVDSRHLFKVPKVMPEIVALLTSGLTASIALEQAARITSSDTVLITAAAGGTGQFFVQLAKQQGAHVIATCGSVEKEDLLRSLGANTIINYKQEDLKSVLKARYPRGISLAIELVGGTTFETALHVLAPGGRLVIIGAMSQYSSGWEPSVLRGIPERLLAKNQSLIGFFLMNYAAHFQRHFSDILDRFLNGSLKVALDDAPFYGIDQVYDAVDRLQSGVSKGKVVVQILPNSGTHGKKIQSNL